MKRQLKAGDVCLLPGLDFPNRVVLLLSDVTPNGAEALALILHGHAPGSVILLKNLTQLLRPL